MKAERRHELKINSLSWTLQQLPETAKKYQSQIALVLVLAAVAVLLVRYRSNSAQQRVAEARQSLGIAGEDLRQLESIAPYPGADLQMVMRKREDIYSDGLQQADQVLQKAAESQAALKAQALILKGDFNFDMANFPDLPGAATQPSLQPAESAESLLSNAADAYTQVLQNYASDKSAVTAAHFGLAAVAENRGAWNDAKTQYQAIVDGDAEAPYKVLASMRLAILPQLEEPVAMDVSAATQPSSRPAK
ncbi:MAG TPA: hypothetical protein VHX86_15765 [Tepidisphaeraceae bacterium]|jgi:hypothetical protein|nr:hypothetical protein [Tepidisphaeraceae bacterium]